MKHALIVGGTRELGRVIAAKLQASGHFVSVMARKRPEDPLPGGASFHQCDLADRDSCQRALDESLEAHGLLSTLVFLQRYRGDDAWPGEIETGLTATKEMIESCATHFTSPGSIVVVASVAGSLVGHDQPVGYHVVKAGLIQMMRYYAVQLGEKNVRVNAVSPSAFIKREGANTPEIQEMYQSISPLKRIGTVDDVANAVLFLAGDAASFITGQELVVDGGITVQNQESLAKRLVAKK